MNKRDRSPAAEKRRIERSHVIDFTGWFGLMRALVQHKPAVVARPRPKRGWAAARRAAPFADYLQPEEMEIARRRHKWRQKELQA